MMGDLFRFYRLWLKRTFSGWFKRVEGWASTVALLVAVVLLIVPRSPEIERVAGAAPAIFFVAVFALVVAARLMLAPYWLYREERVAREALERAREPSLVLSLPDPPVINSIALRGTTHESLEELAKPSSQVWKWTWWRSSALTLVVPWQRAVVPGFCRHRGQQPTVSKIYALRSPSSFLGGRRILKEPLQPTSRPPTRGAFG